MYAGHENHQKRVFPPENSNQPIWRYRDFRWFKELLRTYSLYFRRIDKFNDPCEGRLPKAYLKARRAHLEKIGHSQADINNRIEGSKRVYNSAKKWHYANCWHMNERESSKMWDEYTTEKNAIVIRSTYKRLKNSLCRCDRRFVYIGEITYITDYEQGEFRDSTGTLAAAFHKWDEFKSEMELRAIMPHERLVKRETIGDIHDTPKETDFHVVVDLDVLVESVYVSPKSSESFRSIVKSVMDKHGLNKKVYPSQLTKSS